MNVTKQAKQSMLLEQLERLSQESSAIRKTLEHVAIERQKNKVQALEIQSKLKELMDQVNAEAISDFQKGKDSYKTNQLDDAATINKTKLNLDVTYRKYEKVESESEESD